MINKLVVGVVTFNNSCKELDRFYEAFQNSVSQVDSSVEITLCSIDNADQSGLSLRPEVNALPSQGNIGFGKAVNNLMRYAFDSLKADVFITCNPDGFFHANALNRLIQAHSTAPSCIIEAKTFPEEHPKTYDFKTGETVWASGCCLLIPKNVFEATAGFDENFFLYMEDVDFSLRVRDLGFGVKYCPQAIYGHGLVGRGEGSIPRRKYLLISGRYFAWKWKMKKALAQCETELIKEYKVELQQLSLCPEHKYKSLRRKARHLMKGTEFFIFSPVRW